MLRCCGSILTCSVAVILHIPCCCGEIMILKKLCCNDQMLLWWNVDMPLCCGKRITDLKFCGHCKRKTLAIVNVVSNLCCNSPLLIRGVCGMDRLLTSVLFCKKGLLNFFNFSHFLSSRCVWTMPPFFHSTCSVDVWIVER